jgi:hypothetical protein
MPGAISKNMVHIWLHVSIKILCIYYISTYIEKHNPGTPQPISNKLGTHMTICIYNNLVYIKKHNPQAPGAISTKLGTHYYMYA